MLVAVVRPQVLPTGYASPYVAWDSEQACLPVVAQLSATSHKHRADKMTSESWRRVSLKLVSR